MNVSSLTQYVALFCLLAFTAFSNALLAQSTEEQAQGSGEKAAPVVRKMVIRTNTNPASQGSQGTATALIAPMLFSGSPSRPCCKSAQSNATGAAGEVSVVEINTERANGAEPKRIVVKRTVENGRETITVNGKQVEGDIHTADLSEDVRNMLEDMPAMSGTGVENLGDDNIRIFKFGGRNGEGSADGAQVFTFESDGDGDGDNIIEKHVWVKSPNCAVFGADSGQVYKFDFKFDAEGMKQHCEDMAKRFSEMGMDSAISNRCHIRIRKHLGALCDSSKNFMAIAPMPQMFTMDMSKHMNIMVEVPDAPAVRSFETDDLGEVPELFDAPEADVRSDAPTTQVAPDARKRYRVIIIERPDGDKEAAVEIESADAVVEAEQNIAAENTLPSGVEDNAIKAEYFNVYPNPTPGALNISFALTQPGTVTVTVSDLLGNKVFGEVVERLQGQYYKQLDMTQYSRGTYIVRVEQNGRAISRAVVVQ